MKCTIHVHHNCADIGAALYSSASKAYPALHLPEYGGCHQNFGCLQQPAWPTTPGPATVTLATAYPPTRVWKNGGRV